MDLDPETRALLTRERNAWAASPPLADAHLAALLKAAEGKAATPRWRRFAWLGGVGVALVLVGVGVGIASHRSPAQAPTPAPLVQPRPVATAPVSTPTSAAEPDLVAPIEPPRPTPTPRVGRAPTPAAPAEESSPVVAPTEPTPAAAGDDPLAAELALIRDARAALRAHDAATALARLETHAARYPNGVLAIERGRLERRARCVAEGLELVDGACVAP